MPKTKRKQLNTLTTLRIIISLLAVACVALVLVLIGTKEDTPRTSPSVSLGIMEHVVQDGRATKRHDTAINELRGFLYREAAQSGCPAESPAYEHVVATNKDETQLLLKFGCGAADSPMYAAKVDGAWKSLSPTNQFDTLGIPSCEHLSTNNISREIAPVCVNLGSEPTYLVR